MFQSLFYAKENIFPIYFTSYTWCKCKTDHRIVGESIIKCIVSGVEKMRSIIFLTTDSVVLQYFNNFSRKGPWK